MTRVVAQAAFPKSNLLLKLRDELGPIYASEQFATLYLGLGQPSLGLGRLAMVTGLQFMEDLTDREAAEVVRSRIDWKERKTASGKPNLHFAFSLADCFACTARTLCIQAEKIGRHLSVPPKEAYLALREARQRQMTEVFKELYHERAGVEGTTSLAVNAMAVCFARYHGLLRIHLQHLAMALALNLQRVADWLMGERPEATRISPFAALVAPI